jgi:signal transduction histidine kinase
MQKNKDQITLIKLKNKLKQSQNFSKLLILQHEEDRKEISRELHDEISQILTGVNFQLAALSKAAAKDAQKLIGQIKQVQELIIKSIQNVHRFAKELRPRVIDDFGIVEAIHAYAKDFETNSSINVDFKCNTEIQNITEVKKLVLFRVTQEAFSNIAKHAQAKNVWVNMSYVRKTVTLKIKNDGKVFSVKKISTKKNNGRLGILGMKERIYMINGTFELISNVKNGTILKVTLPI